MDNNIEMTPDGKAELSNHGQQETLARWKMLVLDWKSVTAVQGLPVLSADRTLGQ